MNYAIISYRYSVLGTIQEVNSEFQKFHFLKVLFTTSKSQRFKVSKMPCFKVLNYRYFQFPSFEIPHLQKVWYTQFHNSQISNSNIPSLCLKRFWDLPWINLHNLVYAKSTTWVYGLLKITKFQHFTKCHSLAETKINNLF